MIALYNFLPRKGRSCGAPTRMVRKDNSMNGKFKVKQALSRNTYQPVLFANQSCQ